MFQYSRWIIPENPISRLRPNDRSRIFTDSQRPSFAAPRQKPLTTTAAFSRLALALRRSKARWTESFRGIATRPKPFARVQRVRKARGCLGYRRPFGYGLYRYVSTTEQRVGGKLKSWETARRVRGYIRPYYTNR